MKYPYIGKGKESGTVVVMVKPECGLVISSKTWATKNGNFETSIDESYIANITREYLANTWGVVESKEHAEFIVDLAELHGFELIKMGIGGCNFFNFGSTSFALLSGEPAFKGDCKQITIPLPPKAEINEAGHNLVFAASECKEWPCINDTVQPIDDKYNHGTCEVVKVKTNDSGVKMALVYSLEDSYPFWSPISELQKPKTPEEALRDDIVQLIDDADGLSSHVLALALLQKYNITPKD